MDRAIAQQRTSLRQYIETKNGMETACLVRRHHGVLQKLVRSKNYYYKVM